MITMRFSLLVAPGGVEPPLGLERETKSRDADGLYSDKV
jgi:hypothetical protein